MRTPTLLGWSLACGFALAMGCAKDSGRAANPPPTAPTAEAAAVPTPAEPVAAEAATPAEPRLVGEGQGYKVAVKPPESCTVGTETKAEVLLTPTDGYKVNKEFPTTLSVKASDGVTVKAAEQTPAEAAHFDDKSATFDVVFTCTSAGNKDFGATFKFAVCTDTTCDPKREKLAWVVTAAQ